MLDAGETRLGADPDGLPAFGIGLRAEAPDGVAWKTIAVVQDPPVVPIPQPQALAPASRPDG